MTSYSRGIILYLLGCLTRNSTILRTFNVYFLSKQYASGQYLMCTTILLFSFFVNKKWPALRIKMFSLGERYLIFLLIISLEFRSFCMSRNKVNSTKYL